MVRPRSGAKIRVQRAGRGRNPMWNCLVLHFPQVDLVAGRPFFTVTASMSRDAVLALYLTQQISTG